MAEASESACCVERLTPKTVPINLLALGTVIDISAQQLKLQITGGVICLVELNNISQALAKHIRVLKFKSKEIPRLIDLFKLGQQLACKVIDRRPRKGYADAVDIIATTDPSRLQEDNLPTTLLSIPSVPLQGAVLSVEDHGYRVDIGFKNIIGFLSFDETSKKDGAMSVGQVFRCSTKGVLGDESRIVQLSRIQDKLAQFTDDKCGQCVITPKCILPGSKGHLIVREVRRDGLIVNFLADEKLRGFVSASHLKDDWHDIKSHYKISNQIKCLVLYYNPTTNLFALSLRTKNYKSQIKTFLDDYYPGQIIKGAQVVGLNGSRSITFKVGDHKAIANTKDALDEDVGTMDRDQLLTALDSAYPVDSKHKCRIKSINYADLTLVLSLRQEFIEQTCVSVKELEPADFLEVTIKKYVKDGIVVSFGLNLRAIILNGHLKDYQSAKSYKRYPLGKTIKTRVLKVDSEKYPARVYLTNKDQLMDPDMTVIDTYDKSFRGITVSAIVVKLKHDGLIVELFNNVKGFIPRRFCSSTPIRTLGGLFEIGQVVSCTVYRVEPERQSLLLGIIPIEKIIALKKERKNRKKSKKTPQGADSPTKRSAEKKSASEVDKDTTLEAVMESGDEGIEQEDADEQELSQESEEEADGDKEEMSEDEADEPMDVEVPERTSKSRLARSIEAKLREEQLRKTEQALMDKSRPAQTVADFERLLLKTPNSADAWIKYSDFFLDNVETEKARIVCRRALRTINFRLEKEKLKIWQQMIKIEAKYGGAELLRQIIDEASQTNDKLALYQRAAQTLINCGDLEEAEKLHELSLKLGRSQPDIWIGFIQFLMEHKKDLDRARQVFEQATKSLKVQQADLIYLRSRFAHLEFKHGDVERGKTLFENLLSENPKRKDIWKVYEAAIRKFGNRQLDTEELREQNERILERIATL